MQRVNQWRFGSARSTFADPEFVFWASIDSSIIRIKSGMQLCAESVARHYMTSLYLFCKSEQCHISCVEYDCKSSQATCDQLLNIWIRAKAGGILSLTFLFRDTIWWELTSIVFIASYTAFYSVYICHIAKWLFVK